MVRKPIEFEFRRYYAWCFFDGAEENLMSMSGRMLDPAALEIERLWRERLSSREADEAIVSKELYGPPQA